MHASRDKRQKTKDKSTHTHTTPLVHNIVGKDRSSHHLPASCATKHLCTPSPLPSPSLSFAFVSVHNQATCGEIAHQFCTCSSLSLHTYIRQLTTTLHLWPSCYAFAFVSSLFIGLVGRRIPIYPYPLPLLEIFSRDTTLTLRSLNINITSTSD
jgi:hypothetical protein